MAPKSLPLDLPVEIWCKIYAYLQPPPRILELEYNDPSNSSRPSFSCFSLPSHIERIPRHLYFNAAMVSELRKTHTVSFQGLMEKPVLFDKKHDVLVLKSLLVVERFASLYLASKTLYLLRTLGVQCIAITFVGDDASMGELYDSVTECVWLFGSVRKVFFLNLSRAAGFSDDEIERVREKVEKRLEECVGRWAEIGEPDARNCKVVKWIKPVVVVARSEQEMLGMV